MTRCCVFDVSLMLSSYHRSPVSKWRVCQSPNPPFWFKWEVFEVRLLVLLEFLKLGAPALFLQGLLTQLHVL